MMNKKHALFRDGKKLLQANNLVVLWGDIINTKPFAISGTINKLHFAVTLDKGYEIKEIEQ